MRWRWRTKWALTLLTVVLALGCGPWLTGYRAQSHQVKIGSWILEVWLDGPAGPMQFYAPVWTGVTYPPEIAPRLFRYLRSNFLLAPRLIVNLGTCLAIVLPFTLWLWYRDRHRRRKNECSVCNYNLTGNTTGTCPECGQPAEDPA